jgi:23S rRNA (cytosine1962-C5)-methyltransferase
MKNYELLDSGNFRKLERFGKYVLARPCSQAVWQPKLPSCEWKRADAIFTRIDDKKWQSSGELPDSWEVEIEGIVFKLSPTDFGHLGIFPEQARFWKWIKEFLKNEKTPAKVLNLFAYSGGVTMACAQAQAEVCHLDASKGMCSWAKENVALNGLQNAPIRWIIDDVQKFLSRELRRKSSYDAIILDPPTFGRGSQGEVFKIESHILPLLESCKKLLSDRPRFVLFSCHTPGFTPITLQNLLAQTLKECTGSIDSGEMVLSPTGCPQFDIPSGSFARWVSDDFKS